MVVLLLYVNDMIITGSDPVVVVEMKHLFCEFEMKDIGLVSYFFGIEIASSPKGYLFSQSEYVTEIIYHV